MTYLTESRDALAKADEALSEWERKGPTSLTVALLAEALYGLRGAVIPADTLADDEALLIRTAELLDDGPDSDAVGLTFPMFRTALRALAAALTERSQ